MHEEIAQLEPQLLWDSFVRLNAVPRASKKEQRVTQFAAEFGRGLGLETVVDSAGNVLIRKPATTGKQDRPAVVLQAHLDMVHQKNSDTQFDFDTQGIQMILQGDWVKAQGTTLGADNGIGVAAIMALLQSKDIPHPRLEALFTIDEETGMTGAKMLNSSWLEGRVLLNLDTEEDTELTIGCAGGIDVTGTLELNYDPLPAGYSSLVARVRGLTGGHSGMDIHLGRGNANKLINRLLWQATQRFAIRLGSLDGGSLRNAIPREATAQLAVKNSQLDSLQLWFTAESQVILSEYAVTDPQLSITLEPCPQLGSVLDPAQQQAILATSYAIPNGIFRMSPSVPGLVQSSNNLARVFVQDGKLQWACLTRSSVDSERDDLARMIQAILELAGASVTLAGDYPGWQPAPQSGIVTLMSQTYVELFGSQPHVAACHAGLECGIIGAHFPGMEMISFGPNIRGAHSPDEMVQVSSVQKFWRYLLRVLETI
jgi:dipeptidase D